MEVEIGKCYLVEDFDSKKIIRVRGHTTISWFGTEYHSQNYDCESLSSDGLYKETDIIPTWVIYKSMVEIPEDTFFKVIKLHKTTMAAINALLSNEKQP